MKRLSLLAISLIIAISAYAGNKPFFFVQLSDTQMGFHEEDPHIEQSEALFNAAVDAINRIRPAFVVITGDMLDKWYSQQQRQAFKTIVERIDSDIPVYYSPGNHDYKAHHPGTVSLYREYYGDDRFAFSYGGSYFLGFNSCLIKDDMETQEAEQFRWIQKRLARHRRADHIFLFTHCSIIRESPDEKTNYFNFQEPYRSKYLQLCRDYGVDAVFTGHFHRSRYVELDGTQYITDTATGNCINEGISAINIVTVYPDHFSYNMVPAAEAVNPLLSEQ